MPWEDNSVILAQNYALTKRISISQKKMTTKKETNNKEECPAEGLLKALSGKWKPQIFLLATKEVLRFNHLLRQLPEASKQSISVALKELVEEGFLEKKTIRLKPLHIEYTLSEKGKSMIPVFLQIEKLL